MKLFFHARYKYIFLSHCRYFCVSGTSFRVFLFLVFLFILFISRVQKQSCDVTVAHFPFARSVVCLLFIYIFILRYTYVFLCLKACASFP